MNPRKKNLGIPGNGGEYAHTTRPASGVSLGGLGATEPQPEKLTLQQLEHAQALHGTYDADSSMSYYENMQLVFAAAADSLENDPVAQQEKAKRKAADELADYLEIPDQVVRDVAEAMEDDPRFGTDRKGRQLQLNETANSYRMRVGEVIRIDEQMRAAVKPPRADRAKLRAQQRVLENQIAALDVNELADTINQRFPGTKSMTAQMTHDGYEGEVEVEFFNVTGRSLGKSDPEDLSGIFDNVVLVPDKYNSRSPLRTCTTEDD